ncbi:MAG TPA: STAS domain-containing protein [Blastocatellia bacterium]
METHVDTVDEVTVLTIDGDSLDASNTKDFKEATGPVVERSTRLVFDLSRLRFVDSSGLGAILSCLRQLNASGGELKLCGMTKPVKALFELVRMHRIFDIFGTREEAVKAFSH